MSAEIPALKSINATVTNASAVAQQFTETVRVSPHATSPSPPGDIWGAIFGGPFGQNLSLIILAGAGIAVFLIAVVLLAIFLGRGGGGAGAQGLREVFRHWGDADLIVFSEDPSTRTISIIPMRRMGNMFVSLTSPTKRLLSYLSEDVLNFFGKPALFAVEYKGYLFSQRPSRDLILSMAMKRLERSVGGFGDLVASLASAEGELSGEIAGPGEESIVFTFDRNIVLQAIKSELRRVGSSVFDGMINLIMSVEKMAESLEATRGLFGLMRMRFWIMLLAVIGVLVIIALFILSTPR